MLNAARDIWQYLTPENPTALASGAPLETKRCHALENWDKDLLVVQDLEVKLGVIVRSCGVEGSSNPGGKASLSAMLG